MPDTETRTGRFTLGRGLPFAEAAPAPEVVTDGPPAPGTCANCGTKLVGPYCAQCGQHVADYHRSLWRFLTDFLDNTICWDNKLFRTLEPLFKQPGFLTREFMAGRRVRYVHPLRLFLFTSAVCLTLLEFNWARTFHMNIDQKKAGRAHVSVSNNKNNPPAPAPDPAPVPTPATPAATATPSAEASATPAPTEDGDDNADHDMGAAAIKRALAKNAGSGKVLPDDFGERIAKSVEKTAKSAEDSAARSGDDGKKFVQSMIDGVQQRLSWVALALLPVFALFLRSVYWRKDSYYFAHLIFSLHYHTFLLLFWTAYTGLDMVAVHLPFHLLWQWPLTLCLLLPPYYLFKALRVNYGEGTRRTWVKVFILGGLHLLAIVIGVSAVGAMAFFSVSK